MFEAYGDLAGGGTFVTIIKFNTEEECRKYMDDHCNSGEPPYILGYRIRKCI